MLTDDLVPATLVLLNDHSSSPAEYLNAGRVEANAHDRAVITGIIRLQLCAILSSNAIKFQSDGYTWHLLAGTTSETTLV